MQENVVSNVMKGAGILDLAGMSDVSLVNGVKVREIVKGVALISYKRKGRMSSRGE